MWTKVGWLEKRRGLILVMSLPPTVYVGDNVYTLRSKINRASGWKMHFKVIKWQKKKNPGQKRLFLPFHSLHIFTMNLVDDIDVIVLLTACKPLQVIYWSSASLFTVIWATQILVLDLLKEIPSSNLHTHTHTPKNSTSKWK